MGRQRGNISPPDGPVGLPAGYPDDPPLRLLDAVMLGRLTVDEELSDSVHEALTAEIVEAQMAVVVVRRLDGRPSGRFRRTKEGKKPDAGATARREHTEPILP